MRDGKRKMKSIWCLFESTVYPVRSLVCWWPKFPSEMQLHAALPFTHLTDRLTLLNVEKGLKVKIRQGARYWLESVASDIPL
jgi:hypothetical protein